MALQRFEALDGMRGVAALIVVVFHCDMVLGARQIFPLGWLSVDLFFVLSGFVIALSYEGRLRERFGFSNFMLARAHWLLPVHFCAMAMLTLVLCGMAAHQAFGPAISVRAVLVESALNSLFIPDSMSPVAGAFASLHNLFPLNPAQWSLWDEWVVNIVYALLLFGMRTRILAIAGILSAVMVLLVVVRAPQGWSVGEHNGEMVIGILRALAGFSVGIVIFRLHKAGSLRRLPAVRPELLYLFWMLACATSPMRYRAIYEAGVATVVAPVIIALLVRSERKMPRACNSIGALSYPLYASHFAGLIFASAMFDMFGLLPGVWRTVPMVFVAIGMAEIVRRLSDSFAMPGLARFTTAKQAT